VPCMAMAVCGWARWAAPRGYGLKLTVTFGCHLACYPCAAVPMVEAMVALVLADQLMQHIAQCELFPLPETQPVANGQLRVPSLAEQSALFSES